MPIEEGEIMFVDPERGMLNTKSGMALNFDTSECRGFTPAARNQVTIERIEGMQAFGLSLKSETPIVAQPAVPEDVVNALLKEAEEGPAPKQLSLELLTARVPEIAWDTVFSDVAGKEDGLDGQALVDALAQIQRPFERDEIEEILSATEPSLTSLKNALAEIDDRWPNSWLGFLAWSNGGDFESGEREFQMFTVEQVREYTTSFGIAHYLPGAVPFAMDGGGGVYMFDVRGEPSGGEYPVVFCHSSAMGDGWDGVVKLEDSFLACCQSTSDPASLA